MTKSRDLGNLVKDGAIQFPDNLGTAGQALQVNSAANALEFVDASAGAVVYANPDLLPLTGNSAGDMAYVTSTNRFYINNGSGWYSVSLVNTNPNITSVQDASSGTTPFTLTTDGTATVITITASDPEEVPLTYGYSVTSGSLTNGGGTTATVTQGTGSNTNQFTVTPSTNTAYGGTFEITFTASDGINQAQSVNEFTLSFITNIPNSKYTAMLVQAVGANNGTNSSHPTVLQYLTDSSSSNRSVTVDQGLNVTTGTFSPYRPRGYSGYFPDQGGNAFVVSSHSDFALGTGAFTVSMWVKMAHTYAGYVFDTRDGSNAGLAVQATGTQFTAYRNTTTSSASATVLNTWAHFCWTRDGSGVNKLFVNGTQSGSSFSDSTNYTSQNFKMGESYTGADDLKAHVKDIHIVKGYAYEPTTDSIHGNAEVATGTVFLGCALPYIGDKSTSPKTITTSNGFAISEDSPIDYVEYDVADHGGSIYFSGSDYAQASNSTDFQFYSNPATINFWFYPNSTGQCILIDAYGNGSADSFAVWINSGLALEWRDAQNNYNYLGGYSFAPKQWHYVSIVRDSTTIKLYMGTELKGTATIGSNSFGSNDNLNFGGKLSSFQYDGYMTDIRIVKGTAITPTTVPTAPLTNVTNTKLLLNGTDAAIIDKSGSDNLTLVGNTKCSTTAVVYNSNTISSKSLYFDGSSDYITDLPDDMFAFGYDPFTVEFWVKTSSYPHYTNAYHIIGSSTSSGNKFVIKLSSQVNSGNSNGDTYSISSAAYGNMPTAGNWVHVAFVRTGTGNHQYKCYINGSQSGSETDNTEWGTATDNTIGATASGNYGFSGYLQDLRVTKGYARYTSNFTPPTAELKG